MSEFDKIKDVEGWTAKLGEILDAAKEAAKQDELQPRLDVNERLMSFVENSFPNTDEIKALDDIATKTAANLLNQTIEQRLQSITERTGEYQKLSKHFATVAEDNEAKASSIRLEAITSFIDSSVKVVEAAKELKKSLKDPGDAKLADKIGEMIEAIEELRSSVGKKI